MAGFPFENQGVGLVYDAVNKIEADASGSGKPEFDAEQIVIARGGFVAETAFDDGENNFLLLQLSERRAKLPEEFAARLFEEFEITGIVNVISHRAIGISHTIRMAEGCRAHIGMILV